MVAEAEPPGMDKQNGVWQYSWGDVNKPYVYSPHIENWKLQGTDGTKIQGIPMSFRWGVSYRSRKDSKTTVSPNPTAAWVTAHQSWTPRAHCTAGSKFNSLGHALFLCLSLFELLSRSKWNSREHYREIPLILKKKYSGQIHSLFVSPAPQLQDISVALIPMQSLTILSGSTFSSSIAKTQHCCQKDDAKNK